jgi:hypothetical protein
MECRRLVLLDPVPPEGGGGAPAPESAPPEPVALDSTAGMSAAELAQRPSFQDSRGPGTGTAGSAQAGGAPADPNLAAALGAGAGLDAPAQAQSPGIRDAALSWGLDLSEFSDDAAAWQYLMTAAQRGTERNYYAELGQQMQPHYETFQRYLQDQQAQTAAPAPAKPSAWQHPDFDQRWLGLVERDPATGTYRPKAGINPQWADRVQAYYDSIDSWATGMVQSPEQTLGPLIRQVASQLMEERFGAQAQQQQAQQIYAANEAWLYQTDAQGRRQYDAAGRAIPSAMGSRYYTHLQTLQRAGVTDAALMDSLAQSLLQADVYAAQQQQAQMRTQQQAAPAAAARPNVNTGQGLAPARRDQLPGGSQPSDEGLSLSEMLRRDLHAAGVSDADFQSS